MAKGVSIGGGGYHNQGFKKNWMGNAHFDKGIYTIARVLRRT